MGGAIARGLSTCDLFRPQDITVINRRASKTAEIQEFNPELPAVTGAYSTLATAYCDDLFRIIMVLRFFSLL